MIDTKQCEWLLENADAPIRYRVARELVKDDAMAKGIEGELLENPTVQLWLKNLKPETPPQHHSMEHGSFDFCLENALLKAVQLGLHAGLPAVADAVAYYLNKARHLPGKPLRVRIIEGIHFLGCNVLACAGFIDGAVIDYLLGSLNELYTFAREGNYDIYCNEEERAALKGIPAVYREREIIKSSIVDVHGYCYPLIYDMVGLSSLYAMDNPEVDRKIDTVIRYISTDDFHNSIADGYGVLPPYQGKYHTMGWDPKYPGWFGAADYLKNGEAAKLLFFAAYISRYPAARETKWFSDLLGHLEKYRTESGTYLFPAKWMKESRGYAVMGHHMSFGESRRKKNWLEIESTFYVQLLNQ